MVKLNILITILCLRVIHKAHYHFDTSTYRQPCTSLFLFWISFWLGWIKSVFSLAIV